MKKIIAIGTSDAKYHPLTSLAELGDTICGYSLLCTNDHSRFLDLNEYSMLICYVDEWEHPLEADHATALKEYISSGGKILSIHNGISTQNTPGLTEITGARFTQHPPSENLLIQPIAGHPVTEGVPAFTVFDEPYHYEISEPINILATYDWRGEAIPAAWERSYGKGKLVYLMPGHDSAVFQNEAYQQLIQNSIRYLLDSSTLMTN